MGNNNLSMNNNKNIGNEDVDLLVLTKTECDNESSSSPTVSQRIDEVRELIVGILFTVGWILELVGALAMKWQYGIAPYMILAIGMLFIVSSGIATYRYIEPNQKN